MSWDEQMKKQESEMNEVFDLAETILKKVEQTKVPRVTFSKAGGVYSEPSALWENRDSDCQSLREKVNISRSLLESQGPGHFRTIETIKNLFDYACLLDHRYSGGNENDRI